MPKSKKRKTNHQSNNSNSNTDGHLSHDEIWDDSALLRSWNDAVAEYEYYHSIFARREDVDEVLARAEAEEARGVEGRMTGGEVGRTSDDDIGENVQVNGKEREEMFVEDAEEGEIDDDNDDVNVSTRDQKSAVEVDGDGSSGLAKAMQRQAAGATHSVPSSSANAAAAGATSATPASRCQHEAGVSTPNGESEIHTNLVSVPAVSNSNTEVQAQTLEKIKMAYYWAGYYSGLYDGQRQAQPQSQNSGKES